MDNDRSHIINGKKYATILDSLNFFLNKESINSINIATPNFKLLWSKNPK